EAVEARKVPRRAGERYPHFLVNSPDIPVHFEALPIHRANGLKRDVKRIAIAGEPRRVVLATDREGDRPRGKIKQVAVEGQVTYRELIFTGILQVPINL